jgi:hypothetical protein
MLFLNFVKLKLKNKVSAKQLVREDNNQLIIIQNSTDLTIHGSSKAIGRFMLNSSKRQTGNQTLRK